MTIPKVEKFKYLGSIIQQKGDIDEDINQGIKAVGLNEERFRCAV